MFLEAFLFGLTIAVAIGPIALLILNVSLTRGVSAGIACGAGAASADFTFALAAFTVGAGVLAALEAWRPLLALFGALLLCALGLWLAVDAWRSRQRPIAAKPVAVAGPGFRATYFLTLSNPLTIMFFSAWLGSRRGNPGIVDALLFAFAVFAGSLVVQTGLAVGGAALRPLLTRPRVLFGANLASGAGILAFGIVQLTRLQR